MSNEKRYTDEEIRAIVDDAVAKAKTARKEKLTLGELDNVAGGGTTVIPPTHEEIDKAWDIIDRVWKAYGKDVASIVAEEMKLINSTTSAAGGGTFGKKTLDECRTQMHEELDGSSDYWSKTYHH